MKIIRRILGVMVMIAGILGLILSLAGLVGMWLVKPNVVGFIDETFVTFTSTVETSKNVTEISGQALGATVDSLNALTIMLESTASSVEDTQPVMEQLDIFLSDTMPDTLNSASESLRAAQQAAVVMESTVQQLQAFQYLVSNVPLLNGFITLPDPSSTQELALAESLGELAVNLEGMPEMFTSVSSNLVDTDDNLGTIQSSLVTMTGSVELISLSLESYEVMITQSVSSMENLETSLVGMQNQVKSVLDGVAIALSLVLFWLLMAQVVILSQGWELYQGTAGRMESANTLEAVETTANVQAGS